MDSNFHSVGIKKPEKSGGSMVKVPPGPILTPKPTPPKPTGIVSPSLHSSTKSPSSPSCITAPSNVVTPIDTTLTTSTTPTSASATPTSVKRENGKASLSENSLEGKTNGMREFSIPLRKTSIAATLDKYHIQQKISPTADSTTPSLNQVKQQEVKKKPPVAPPFFTPRQITNSTKSKKMSKPPVAPPLSTPRQIATPKKTSKPAVLDQGIGREGETPAMPAILNQEVERGGEAPVVPETAKKPTMLDQGGHNAPVVPATAKKSAALDQVVGRGGEAPVPTTAERLAVLDQVVERRKESPAKKGTPQEICSEPISAVKSISPQPTTLVWPEGSGKSLLEIAEEVIEEKKGGRMEERVEEKEGKRKDEKEKKEENGRGREKPKPKQTKYVQQSFMDLSDPTSRPSSSYPKSLISPTEGDVFGLSSILPTPPHLDSMQLSPFSLKQQKVAMVSPLPHSSSTVSSKPVARVKPNLHLSPIDSGSKISEVYQAQSGFKIKDSPTTPSPHLHSLVGGSSPWVVTSKSHDISEERLKEGRKPSSSDGKPRGWKVLKQRVSAQTSGNEDVFSSSKSAKKKRKKKKKHKHHSHVPSTSESSDSETEHRSAGNKHQRRTYKERESAQKNYKEQEERETVRKRSRRDYSDDEDDDNDDRHWRRREHEVRHHHSKKHKKLHKKHKEEKERVKEKRREWEKVRRKHHRHSTTSYIHSPSSCSDSESERDRRHHRESWKHSEKKREKLEQQHQHSRHHKHHSPSPHSDEDRRRKRERRHGGGGGRSRSPDNRKKMRLDSSSRKEVKDRTKKLRTG